MNAIHSSTIRLSHNNNWWNSSEKQIFNDVVSVHGAVRVLLFYLHQLFWFYWIFICSRAHTRSTWEIHWNNNWVMRWYQCTLLLHNWENIQWNILSQWRIQSVFLFCVTFSKSFDSLNSKLISIPKRFGLITILTGTTFFVFSHLITVLNNVKQMSKMTNCYRSTEI